MLSHYHAEDQGMELASEDFSEPSNGDTSTWMLCQPRITWIPVRIIGWQIVGNHAFGLPMWQEGLLVGSRAGVGKCRLIAKHFLAVTTRLCRATLNASICGVWQSKHLHSFSRSSLFKHVRPPWKWHFHFDWTVGEQGGKLGIPSSSVP